MTPLRFAMFGTGFWSRFQLSGWNEVGGLECVAFYNRTVSKAQALAAEYGVPRVYGSPEELLDNEELDFVDICTAVETHAALTKMAAERGLDVVCQKPMATSLQEAETMLRICQEAGVKLIINENFRFETTFRQVKKMLDSGRIGKPFRARLQFVTSFPVFDNQPFLKELDQFMLTDVGSHVFDVARYLFGDARSLYATTARIHPDIKGEDVATAMLKMGDGVTVLCELSYASKTEIERFPQTFAFIEGDKGSLELTTDYWIRETTADGTLAKRYPPPRYTWADPAYDIVHSAIVPAQANIAAALRGETLAETRAEDNIKTVRLVFGAYDSAAENEVLRFE